MVPVEIPDETGVDDVPGWDPLSLLRSVPLPVYQVLPTPSPAANRQQSFNPIHRASFYDHGRWRGRDSRDHGALLEPAGNEAGEAEPLRVQPAWLWGKGL